MRTATSRSASVTGRWGAARICWWWVPMATSPRHAVDRGHFGRRRLTWLRRAGEHHRPSFSKEVAADARLERTALAC